MSFQQFQFKFGVKFMLKTSVPSLQKYYLYTQINCNGMQNNLVVKMVAKVTYYGPEDKILYNGVYCTYNYDYYCYIMMTIQVLYIS